MVSTFQVRGDGVISRGSHGFLAEFRSPFKQGVPEDSYVPQDPSYVDQRVRQVSDQNPSIESPKNGFLEVY